MISWNQKTKKFWIHIFLVIFKTDLPYYIDRLFLNEYLRSNTALKMQSDFTCIFLPKMDQSLRAKISWTIKNFQKIFYHHPTFMVWHNITENKVLLRTSLPISALLLQKRALKHYSKNQSFIQHSLVRRCYNILQQDWCFQVFLFPIYNIRMEQIWKKNMTI